MKSSPPTAAASGRPDKYAPGRDQDSFDKQFVRNYLEKQTWNKQPPAPALPEDVVAGTRQKYVQAYELLTDRHWTDA